jgi:hypothetical protein
MVGASGWEVPRPADGGGAVAFSSEWQDPMMKTLAPPVALIAALVVLGGTARSAQDRSALKVPDGLSFSEFNGYEAWQDVAVSQTDEGLKLIAGNPAAMSAYAKGLPAKDGKFPEGTRLVKIEWARQPNPVSPYAVMVPGALKSVSFMVKDTRRFPKTAGWAYAQFTYDPASQALKPRGTGSDCGHACHTAVATQDYVFTARPPR